MTTKKFIVSIELETQEISVSAANKTEARKKALAKLNRRKPSAMIRRAWPSKTREIDVELIE